MILCGRVALGECCFRVMYVEWGPTEGACSMAVPAMNTRHSTSALRMPSTHPAIRKANHR